jgi:hypothetical protein
MEQSPNLKNKTLFRNKAKAGPFDLAVQKCVGCLTTRLRSGSGCPRWANFRPLGGLFILGSSNKFLQEAQVLGPLFYTVKIMH